MKMTLSKMMMMIVKKIIYNLKMEKEVSNTEEDGLNPSEFKELSDISDDDVSLAKIYFAKDKY